MKLLTCKPELRTEKSFPGLLDCVFTHKIQSATATAEYKGPLIDPILWKEVLAFFQWTYDTTHSESQVRLFINTNEHRWSAWAFPQEARTGMTSNELDTPDMKEQRAAFSDAQGWVYFGTVHHHCDMGAFQSGTDQANEVGIDGLHITVGFMGRDRYDLHARFCLGGFQFEPDLSRFWDIGANLRQLLPQDLWDRVARFQMCERPAANTEFPARWRDNLIEVKTATFHSPTGYPWSRPASKEFSASGVNTSLPRWIRARHAVGKLALELLDDPRNKADQRAFGDWIEALHTGCNPISQVDDGIVELFNVMGEYDVQLIDMWGEIPANGDLDGALKTYQSSTALEEDEWGSHLKQLPNTGKALGLGTPQTQCIKLPEESMYSEGMMD
ncbi:MAG TPA: hypothetical protein VLK33_00570 [Terriglobales bacterium]|nr:hypothetical protein [Terriglobales bacterium]